jgi:hypothetical protein
MIDVVVQFAARAELMEHAAFRPREQPHHSPGPRRSFLDFKLY